MKALKCLKRKNYIKKGFLLFLTKQTTKEGLSRMWAFKNI